MISSRQYVVFHLNNQQHALPLGTVDRIIHAVAVTSVPGAAAPMVGVINVQGCMLPVISLRLLFGLPPQEIALGDQFIIVRRDGSPTALIVDAVSGLVALDAQDTSAGDRSLARNDQVAGMYQDGGGMILLHDLDQLLGRPVAPHSTAPMAQSGAAW